MRWGTIFQDLLSSTKGIRALNKKEEARKGKKKAFTERRMTELRNIMACASNGELAAKGNIFETTKSFLRDKRGRQGWDMADSSFVCF